MLELPEELKKKYEHIDVASFIAVVMIPDRLDLTEKRKS